MWAELNLVKIYTKKRGAHPDLSDPICLRKGATIQVIVIFTAPCRSPETPRRRRMCVMAYIGLWRIIFDMGLSGMSLHSAFLAIHVIRMFAG